MFSVLLKAALASLKSGVAFELTARSFCSYDNTPLLIG